MRKHGVMSGYILGLLSVGCLLLCIRQSVFWKGQEKKGFGMFSWSGDVIDTEEREFLTECILKAEVSELYQKFSEDILISKETEVSAFATAMYELNVRVYSLTGSAEWALDEEAGELVRQIQKTAEYNRNQSKASRIYGVIVDVEPYLLEEWTEGEESRRKLMESYLTGMETAYDYAKQNKLEFWVCIPNFFDETDRDILERLISDACDGVAVMNYNRTDEYAQMAMEVGFAREYEKKIRCIYELQAAGVHDLKEINTYAEAGIDALWKSAERLKRQFGYEGLGFSYHYYKPLKEMMEEDRAMR